MTNPKIVTTIATEVMTNIPIVMTNASIVVTYKLIVMTYKPIVVTIPMLVMTISAIVRRKNNLVTTNHTIVISKVQDYGKGEECNLSVAFSVALSERLTNLSVAYERSALCEYLMVRELVPIFSEDFVLDSFGIVK